MMANPLFATLDAAMTREPTMTKTPPNVHVCGKAVALRIWPEMGVPISRPMETTVIKLAKVEFHKQSSKSSSPVKHMPILVPIIARFAVKCTRIVGGNETKLPEKKP